MLDFLFSQQDSSEGDYKFIPVGDLRLQFGAGDKANG